jgi:uncharacterized protein (DUF1684 family)
MIPGAMKLAHAGGLPLLVFVCACAGERWPEPPAVDRAQYQQQYEQWLEEQTDTARYALPLIGAWPLDEGDTPFGADASLPIALPAKAGVPRAGIFSRAGEMVTLTPAPGAPLQLEDGTAVTTPIQVGDGTAVRLGPVRLEVVNAPPVMFVSGTDTEHPDLQDLRIETYPVDDRWRVPARFDAFDEPRTVQIATTRGGAMDMAALGQLVFRIGGRESRLTALGEPGGDELFVMFKDETNGLTTYGGYRILTPKAVPDGEWTVLDFNLAQNPPCAYSPYTLCPLPPRENRIPAAVEAGVRRHPTAVGFAGE